MAVSMLAVYQSALVRIPIMLSREMLSFCIIHTLSCVRARGHGWQGCGQPLADAGGGYPFPQEYHTDFGEPQGICSQGGGSSSAVFTREYTKATVKMDCNTGKPTITMKQGSLA